MTTKGCHLIDNWRVAIKRGIWLSKDASHAILDDQDQVTPPVAAVGVTEDPWWQQRRCVRVIILAMSKVHSRIMKMIVKTPYVLETKINGGLVVTSMVAVGGDVVGGWLELPFLRRIIKLETWLHEYIFIVEGKGGLVVVGVDLLWVHESKE